MLSGAGYMDAGMSQGITPADGSVEYWEQIFVKEVHLDQLDAKTYATRLNNSKYKERHIRRMSVDKLQKLGIPAGDSEDIMEAFEKRSKVLGDDDDDDDEKDKGSGGEDRGKKARSRKFNELDKVASRISLLVSKAIRVEGRIDYFKCADWNAKSRADLLMQSPVIINQLKVAKIDPSKQLQLQQLVAYKIKRCFNNAISEAKAAKRLEIPNATVAASLGLGSKMKMNEYYKNSNGKLQGREMESLQKLYKDSQSQMQPPPMLPHNHPIMHQPIPVHPAHHPHMMPTQPPQAVTGQVIMQMSGVPVHHDDASGMSHSGMRPIPTQAQHSQVVQAAQQAAAVAAQQAAVADANKQTVHQQMAGQHPSQMGQPMPQQPMLAGKSMMGSAQPPRVNAPVNGPPTMGMVMSPGGGIPKQPMAIQPGPTVLRKPPQLAMGVPVVAQAMPHMARPQQVVTVAVPAHVQTMPPTLVTAAAAARVRPSDDLEPDPSGNAPK